MHRINTLAVLQFWAYCFCGYAAFLAVYAYLKQKLPKHAQRWMRFLSHARAARKKTRGVAHVFPVWETFFVLFAATMLSYAVTRYHWPEHHNVRILRHNPPDQWWLVDDEDPSGFMYNACHDFNNEAWIKVGYLARHAAWKVLDDCYSIKDDGMGFYYEWKPDGTAKTLREAGYE